MKTNGNRRHVFSTALALALGAHSPDCLAIRAGSGASGFTQVGLATGVSEGRIRSLGSLLILACASDPKRKVALSVKHTFKDKGLVYTVSFQENPLELAKAREKDKTTVLYSTSLGSPVEHPTADLAVVPILSSKCGPKSRAYIEALVAPGVENLAKDFILGNLGDSAGNFVGYGHHRTEQVITDGETALTDRGEGVRRLAKGLKFGGVLNPGEPLPAPGTEGYYVLLPNADGQIGCKGDSGGPLYNRANDQVVGLMAQVSPPKGSSAHCKNIVQDLFLPIPPHRGWIVKEVESLCAKPGAVSTETPDLLSYLFAPRLTDWVVLEDETACYPPAELDQDGELNPPLFDLEEAPK
jgi:hypothetical protein